MELETNQASLKVGKKTNKMTILVGVLLVGVPVCVALFINKPELFQTLKNFKWDILKGAVMGLSSLPVLIFVGIKGGSNWYKKIWCWAILAIMLVGILTMVLMGSTSTMPQDMMSMPGDGMSSEPSGGGGRAMSVPMG